MCQHYPSCPEANATDHAAARVVAAHPEQGWSLLCNGVIVFDDQGEILPRHAASGGSGSLHPIRSHRPTLALQAA